MQFNNYLLITNQFYGIEFMDNGNKRKHMKKLIGIFITGLCLFATTSQAQIEKGNYFIGGDLANFNVGLSKGGLFDVNISPKAAWFIKDNTALGAYVNFHLTTAKGAGTSTTYGVGALGRFYVNDAKTNLAKHGRLFFEGNVGIQGESISNGSNTTGLGFGIGPGYTYFITPNVGLETLLKYNGIVGFGSQPYASNLGLSVGFQVYFSRGKAQQIINEVK